MCPTLLTARSILPNAETLLEGGGLLIRDGRIAGVYRGQAEVERARHLGDARFVDLGEVVIAPGLVDAHAHLELGALAGKLPRTRGLIEWIGALLRERALLGPSELATGLLAGARRLRETGTTTVGDIDSTGAARSILSSLPLRVQVHRELLDAGDPERTGSAVEVVAERLPSMPGVTEGLAPHAPHTTSDSLLESCGRLARRCRLPVTIHWAESPEEVDWLRDGSGPFAGLLGPSPHRSGLARLEAAGFEGLQLSLVHANHPEPGELATAARWGASLVHCPGTHAFFDREPAPLEAWIASEIGIALGTDSLASNEDLDLRREMALLRGAHPELSPERVFDWATRGGARALGLVGEVGELREGAWADLAVFSLRERDRKGMLEELTVGLPPVEATWIAGQPG